MLDRWRHKHHSTGSSHRSQENGANNSHRKWTRTSLNLPGSVAWLGLQVQLVAEIGAELGGSDADLVHAVALADGDGLVLEGLAVDGDAERRAGLVLSAGAPADRALLLVEAVESALQIVVDVAGALRHAFLLDPREHGGLDRGQGRVEPQQVARLAAGLLLVVSVHEERQRAAIHARAGLDHVGDVAGLFFVVEIG